MKRLKCSFGQSKKFQQFLTLFEPEEYNIKLLFTLLFFSGLRLGEALALTWQDIDFLTNTIHITKSVYVNKGVSYIQVQLRTKARNKKKLSSIKIKSKNCNIGNSNKSIY